MGHGAFVRIMMLGCYTDGGRSLLTFIVFVQYDLIIGEFCVQSFKTLRTSVNSECKQLKRKSG